MSMSTESIKLEINGEDDAKAKGKGESQGRDLLDARVTPSQWSYDSDGDRDEHVKNGVFLPFTTYKPDIDFAPDEKPGFTSPEISPGYSLVRPRIDKVTTQLVRTQNALSPVNTKFMRLKHKNDRTPNTLLRMMERHRRNERVRHHTLNKSMMNVCSKVPGVENFPKETKVVMMQRIIAYICYLENSLRSVCDNLGMRLTQLRLPNNLLTDQWLPNTDRSRAKVPGYSCSKPRLRLKDNFSPFVRPYKTRSKLLKRLDPVGKRHLKLSSPTIDSTTDNAVFENEASNDECLLESNHCDIHQVKEEVIDSQNSTATFHCTSKPYGEDMDAFLDHNACPVPSAMEDTPAYFSEDFLPTSTTLDNFPDAFEMMSSPLGARSKYVLLSPKVKAMESLTDFGIRSDKKDFVEQYEYINVHEMRTISPECVLPTTPSPRVNSLLHDSLGFRTQHPRMPFTAATTDAVHTPDKGTLMLKNKRKQYTPHRSPFHNITNLSSQSTVSFSDSDDDQDNIILPVIVPSSRFRKVRSRSTVVRASRIDEQFVSYVPYIWKFHNTAITRRQKAEAARLEAQLLSPAFSEICQEDKKCEEHLRTSTRPVKIDHRKTTWMNGFMMFSRLNRRQFIDANPGVHTSHISKMMGHAWRNMSAQDQQPYKEQAKDYARCIQDVDGHVEEDNVSPTPVVSSSGISLDNSNGDSVDAALHRHMVPFNISG